MKITLTGSSGFVGQNLASYLHDYEIHRLSARYSAEVKIDLEPTDVVIHLSGKAHDLKKASQPSDYYNANYELTKQLYDAFLKSSAKKLIFISSVKATADSVLDILTETTIPNPQTHYGKSKLLAEEYIQAQELSLGKSYYILRPSMIHGPGNKGNLNLLYKLVSKGFPYPLASFLNRRSFLSIENLCFIIKELIERDDIPSGIYNVADDDPLSTNEVITLLAHAQNKSPRLLKISQSVISFIAKIGDKVHLPLTTERLQKLTENFVVSNHKIKRALKKDLPLSAREGIIRTAKSFERR